MKRLVVCLVWFAVCLASNPVLAADRVVVIPLGDAIPGDVLRDKIFSSQTGKGLSSTRFPAKLKKSGQTIPSDAFDDVHYNKGVAASPRWTHMQPNNGGIYNVVTGYGCRDNNTGLIWLEDASHPETGISQLLIIARILILFSLLPV